MMQWIPNCRPAPLADPPRQRASRAGFTLIEMLVVVTIIAVLMTLSAGAIIKFRDVQKKANTRTLIERLDRQLQQQMTFVADQARSQPIPDSVKGLAGSDLDRARVIWVKLNLKKRFPTTFAEALNPAPGYITPMPGYARYLNDHGITSGNPTTPGIHESAACLVMALRHDSETTGEGQAGTTSALKTIGGIPCYVDGWGNPLVFCRWPVGSSGFSAVNLSGPTLGLNDPWDSKGTLTNAAWLNAQGNTFRTFVHWIPGRTAGSPATSLRLAPVILSAGSDGLTGVDLVTLATTNATDATDNLYNLSPQ